MEHFCCPPQNWQMWHNIMWCLDNFCLCYLMFYQEVTHDSWLLTIMVQAAALDDVTTAAATHLDDITTLINFSWQLLGRVTYPWNHSDPVFWVNVSMTRNIHYHYNHFPNSWAAAKFLWLDASVVIPLAKKKLQEDQLNFRFPIFAGGISNSRFSGVVDTLQLHSPLWGPGLREQGLLHFQGGGHKRRPNLAVVFFLFISCYSILCYWWVYAFVVVLVSSDMY